MKTFRWLLALFMLICVVIGWLLFAQKSSVLVNSKDSVAVDPGDGVFVVFNLFRDREPEEAAAAFLESLKMGHCEELKKTLSDVKAARPNCESESRLQLISWELANREERPDEISLHFKANRKTYPKNVYGNIWITVKKQSNQWQIKAYEVWY